MLWAITRVASPNIAELRAKYLQEHLAYLKGQKKILVIAGAQTTDDDKEILGSLQVVNVNTRAEAEAFINGDPFTQKGVFRDIKITRMRKGQWNPEAIEGA